jgi:ATP-dependent exoDNAse (exonuclease V) beta subunit
MGSRPAFAAGPSDGADFGTLVHELFELVNWEEPQAVDRLAGEIAASLDLSGARPAEAAELISGSLASETIKRILRADVYYKEAPFTICDGGRLIHGKIDVLFKEDGGIIVLDFKTDRVSSKETKARAEYYRPQGEAYARAVKIASGSVPAEVVFIFLSTAGAVAKRLNS